MSVKTAPIYRFGDSYVQDDFEQANQLLSECDWDKFLKSDDFDQRLKVWNECFMNIMQSCIPKGVLPKTKNLPWLTKNLTPAMHKRNWLYMGERGRLVNQHGRTKLIQSCKK